MLHETFKRGDLAALVVQTSLVHIRGTREPASDLCEKPPLDKPVEQLLKSLLRHPNATHTKEQAGPIRRINVGLEEFILPASDERFKHSHSPERHTNIRQGISTKR
jgi:hypothetical protein